MENKKKKTKQYLRLLGMEPAHQQPAEGASGLIVVYLRVSDPKQGDKFGLQSQLADIQTYAAYKGYEINEVFVDMFTGTVDSRENLDRLKALLKTGTVAEVLIYDIGRLARDLMASESLYLEFRRNAKVTSVTERFADSIEGDLLRHIKQAFFHYDHAKLLQRMIGGKIQAVKAGRWQGGWGLLGYRSAGKGELRSVIEEIEGKVIPLFELHAERRTKGQIARGLNARGITTMTGRKWDTSSVMNILSNYEFYAGRENIWAGVAVKEVLHEPALPPDLVARIDAAWSRPEGMVTTTEAAKLAEVSVQTIHRWRKAGLLDMVVMKSMEEGEKLAGGRVNYYYFDPAQVAQMSKAPGVKHTDRPKPTPSATLPSVETPRPRTPFSPPDLPAGQMTVQQAAARLGKSSSTVHRLIEQGELEPQGRMRLGTTWGWLLDEAAVDRLATRENHIQKTPDDAGILHMVNNMLAKNRWGRPGASEAQGESPPQDA